MSYMRHTQEEQPDNLISHHTSMQNDNEADDVANENTQLLNKSDNSNVQDVDEKSHYRGIDKVHFWLIFGSMLFGNTIAFFDSTLTASSHPVITSYFHSSNSASWLSTVFYLTSTVSQPLYARISDTIGRRPVSLFAALVFFAGTAWCAVAQSMSSFIAARAACGVGAGGVMAMAGIITGDMVKIEFRGIYQSYYNVAFGMGNTLGAAFGGMLCDQLGWRAAFGIQLPFIFIFGALTFIFTPRNLGPNLAKSQGKTILQALREVDTNGAIVLSVATAGLILGINLGGNIYPWIHPLVLTPLILSLLTTPILIMIEKRAVRPMLPLPLLSTIPNSNLMWSNFIGGITINTVLFNVPLFLQAVRQTTPTTSGLYLISPLICVASTAIFSGFFISITRQIKPMMIVGPFFYLLGSIALVFLQPSTPPWLILILISGTSIGQGFFAPAATIGLLALNSQDDQAVVVTTLALVRNLGSTFGVAISSWVLQNALQVYLDRYITGDSATRKETILEIRKSVNAIATLDQTHKHQAIKAYSKSLQLTFATTIVYAVIIVCIVVPIKMPRLQRQADKDAVVPAGPQKPIDSGGVVVIDEDEEAAAATSSEDTDQMASNTSTSKAKAAVQGPKEPRRPSFSASL